MRVLVLNPGSSSLKAALVEDGTATRSESVAPPEGDDTEVSDVLALWGPYDAVGVRFVHGGAKHLEPVLVTADVLADLDAAAHLAPLHNPSSLAATRAALAWRNVPVVACFDTMFHRTMPPAAYIYALPKEWNQRRQLRRYGFHGLSHEYAARRAAQLMGLPLGQLRVVVCHLGGGASLCAVAGGVSVDTTMGFTPLAGLVMQVRSGSLDPGLVLWLQQRGGVTLEELGDALEHRSGLAGLSGTSGDLREVLAARAKGDADATLAFDVYRHRLVREIGAMVASAGGLDVLVFTGGVGEHSAEVRAAVGADLAWLGVGLDELRGSRTRDRDITASGARVRTLVVESREDLQIAAAVSGLLGG
jgi:acetate kinase